jgi:hypothetical protein
VEQRLSLEKVRGEPLLVRVSQATPVGFDGATETFVGQSSFARRA